MSEDHNDGWINTSLENLAEFINGYAFKPEDWEKSGFPIIRIEQLNDPKAKCDYCSQKLSDNYIIENGNLIFSWSATLSLKIWNRGKAYLNQHLFKVLPKTNVNIILLKYLLELNLDELAGQAHGSTMKHIKRGDLLKFQVNIPHEIEEQGKIASILENVDNTIDKTHEIIEKYEMMKQGLMQDLISNNDFKNDRIVNIDEILLKIKRGPSLSANVDGRGVIYLTSDNINENNKLILNELKYLDNYYETEKCKIEYGDVIINCVNSEERVGKTAFFGINLDNIIVGFNNFALKFDSTVNSKYIYYYLSNDSFQKQIRQRIKPAINQVSFSGRDLILLRIKIPESIKEQKNISDILTSIDMKIESEQKYLNKLQKIKSGLMQDLLTGKVRVKVEA